MLELTRQRIAEINSELGEDESYSSTISGKLDANADTKKVFYYQNGEQDYNPYESNQGVASIADYQSGMRVTYTEKRASIMITQNDGSMKAFKVHESHKGITVRQIIEQCLITQTNTTDQYQHYIDFTKLKELTDVYGKQKIDCI